MGHGLRYDDTMFSVKETPWHGLGAVLDKPPTAEEAMQQSGLDWDVIPEPVYSRMPDGRYVQVSDECQNHRAMVRSTDRKVLAIAGSRYEPMQNRKSFGFFDA